MADGTAIEWTDATWNPITGCSVVSPGCKNCYAMRLAGARLRHDPSRAGLTHATKAGPVWTGEVRFNARWLDQPLRWRRPRRIFVCAHGDLFHEAVPDEWIDRIFRVMSTAPRHTFQVLTKRAERMRRYLSDPTVHGRIRYDARPPWPLPNVWLGVSVEDQRRADERIPILLDTPAAVRWISAEPLLGPISLAAIDVDGETEVLPLGAEWLGRSDEIEGLDLPRLDWVVAGGESGPNARPMHPDWARSLRDQCAAADVPFLWKQNGEFLPVSEAWGPTAASPDDLRGCVFVDPNGITYRLREAASFGAWAMRRVGKKAAGRLLDGVIHDAWPGGAPLTAG